MCTAGGGWGACGVGAICTLQRAFSLITCSWQQVANDFSHSTLVWAHHMFIVGLDVHSGNKGQKSAVLFGQPGCTLGFALMNSLQQQYEIGLWVHTLFVHTSNSTNSYS